ncbi:hypothetical protein TI39_contig396g00001 [Zymoseptoria brevis]|uniref:Uncharacterized protein n=1 Tax=Zymoseptoria brevis TaxID=1047168 RepID=A0A0F4GN96_9PEZI|nr:hypothetical protein TI39_contig396g00001 [Zymoseptoria brevis]
MPVIPGDNDHAMKAALADGKPDSSNKEETRKATIQDHQANPGPVMASAEQLGEPASKEELKKRAEELNKNN